MAHGRSYPHSATNLFFVREGVVLTSRTVACPEGITRATVLDLCAQHDIPSRVDDLSLAEAYRADEAFCTGTMGELASVTEIDGRVIGDGSPYLHLRTAIGRRTPFQRLVWLQVTNVLVPGAGTCRGCGGRGPP